MMLEPLHSEHLPLSAPKAPTSVLKAQLRFQTEAEAARSTLSSLARRGALGSIIPQHRWMGKRTKRGAVQKPQTCNLSKSSGRLCASLSAWLSDTSFAERPRESVSQITAKMAGKTNLFCLVSIDPTPRLAAKVSMTHAISITG